jgi:hypothetical protein
LLKKFPKTANPANMRVALRQMAIAACRVQTVAEKAA